MGYTLFLDLVLSTLNSIFNILNVIMMLYRFLDQQKHLILEFEPCDSLRFWPFKPYFLINFILIKKNLCRVNYFSGVSRGTVVVNQDQQSCDTVSSVKLSLITFPPVGLGHSTSPQGSRHHIYCKMKLKDVA